MTRDELDGVELVLPPWAHVSAKRRGHIERVMALLATWAEALALDAEERRAWLDAGMMHDALRDAEEPLLRALAGDPAMPGSMLHGPAAANLLAGEGERRQPVLDAIRWHTVGYADWTRVGRALYMADFLEPGRPFARADRAFLARQVPADFDGVFRQVVRERLEWTLREGKTIYRETADLWNSVR
jgi:2-amino-4-hydroxy-6-hydroxymethyldihydropteridine diphosphokinase